MPREAPVTTQTFPRSDRSALRAPGEARAKLGVALERSGPGFHRHAAVAPHRTAHLHAAVLRGDDDAGAERSQRLHHRTAHAMHEVLLEDEAMGVRVHRLCDLEI